MAKNITIIRGNSQQVHLRVTDSASLPVIEDSDTIYFTAKPKYDDDSTDAAAVIREDFSAKQVLDPDTGEVSFKLKSDMVNVPQGTYVYDIVLKQADTDRVTLLEGKLKIRPAATLRGYEDAD